MERLGRDAPLPTALQGKWVDVNDRASSLVISGGEVICFGRPVAYDHKLIEEDDGALTASLKIDDEADEDAFQRANITALVITPEGEFHAYNTRFACRFVRAENQGRS